MREAKRHSTWTSPDTVYEEAMQALARDALDSSRGGFLASFLPFAQKIARLGVQNSVIQTVMKLTLPGVPDIYQGCEMWDLSLVDPDNRRPVDYEIRAAALTALRGQLDNMGDRKALLAGLLKSWQDAKIKLAVTMLLLDLRRMQEELFDTGGYEALDGEFSPHANSIPTLQRRGVVFLACHNAILEIAEKLLAAGVNPDKLSHAALGAELTNHLIAGVVLTPGMAGTLVELERAGFAYAA
jgi:maltooligosyltrehalose synthase